MRIRLIRHATLEIEMAGQCLLIDPMLAELGIYPSLTLHSSAGRNPMVPLPGPADTLTQPDAIMVTHCHFDHFDQVAAAQLPKDAPLFCQPSDQRRLHRYGFTYVVPVDASLDWSGLRIVRTGGQHGRGLLGRLLGPTSGFVIQAPGEPQLYIAGDTVWCNEVSTAIERHQPEVVVINSGAAQFDVGAPITMTAQDVVNVRRAAPDAQVIAVHLEAINHCRLTRQSLADYAGASSPIIIPQDGETISC